MEKNQNKPLNPCEEVLAHHGILGMKWGIRRYQPYPKDYHGDGRFVGKTGKSRAKTSYIKKSREALPRVADMSDEELRQLLNRLNQERRLYSMAMEADNKKVISILKSVGLTGGSAVAISKLSKDENIKKIAAAIDKLFHKQ